MFAGSASKLIERSIDFTDVEWHATSAFEDVAVNRSEIFHGLAQALAARGLPVFEVLCCWGAWGGHGLSIPLARIAGCEHFPGTEAITTP